MSISAQQLDADELAQLVHFYAESGVEWMLDETPNDRFAEFAAQRSAQTRQPSQAAPAPVQRPDRQIQATPARMQASVAVPDAEAIADAQRVAAGAASLEELAEAVRQFMGCNLRNGARNAAFLAGSHAARFAIAGGVPSPDDDREGLPFSGPAGQMLGKMLAGIGLRQDEVLMFNFVPWRPPGNRAPTPHETEICRPFSLRLLDLLKPQAVLVLGNYPTKALTGSRDGIHSLRGRKIELDIGGRQLPMMATFHPQELIATPLNKRLAWNDLLTFRNELTG